MAINWPTLAQGAGTGTTYTAPSPGSNIWTWSGYAWGSTGTTAKGGFGSPWVIFDIYGKSTSYPTLSDAVSDATSGDTINLFGDTIEYPTATNHVVLDKNININLNGNTYVLDVVGVTSNATIISNNGNEVKVRITNGTIKLRNAILGKSIILIGEINPVTRVIGCDWFLSSSTFESDTSLGPVAKFSSSVEGGTFYNYGLGSGSGLLLEVYPMTNKFRNIFRNIVATSVNGNGIDFLNGADNTLSLAINCRGYSYKYSDTVNYYGFLIDGLENDPTNRIRLVNCIGSNLGDAAFDGVTYGIMAYGKLSKVINSTGYSRSGNGIYTSESSLIHCTGDGLNNIAGASFYSIGGSVLRRCTSGSNLNVIGLRTAGVVVTNVIGDRIENCNFNGEYGIYGPGGESGNYINIFNTKVGAKIYGICYNVTPYKTRIINSTISPNETITDPSFGAPFSDYYPIILGGTGSYVINNVIEGNGDGWDGFVGNYAIEVGNASSPRVLIAFNTSINNYGLRSPFLTQGMSVPVSNKSLIDGQPV